MRMTRATGNDPLRTVRGMVYNSGMRQEDDFFYTVKTAAGLAAFINRTCEGGTYWEDAPPGCGFWVGRTTSGRFVFFADEYLDDAGKTPNPDYHVKRYDTAAQGVRDFKINGKPLFDALRGRRLWQSDAITIYADDGEPQKTEGARDDAAI